MIGLTALIITLIAIPLVLSLVDFIGQTRSLGAQSHCFDLPPGTLPHSDFTLVVPVWGRIEYLQNVDYLRQYGSRVLLTTSSGESPEFLSNFLAIAEANGFRTHVAPAPPRSTDGTDRRQVGGTMRDTLVRDAHRSITTPYVVCIDADTATDIPVDYLVGRLVQTELDIASVRLVAANRDSLLARLQGHEYRMAMLLRRIMPWMISGACHVARTAVHRDLMLRHSMFFQGNDIELGLLAKARGYRVGHILFTVPTDVPSTWHPWWRQRTAWAAGVFRIMVVNIRLGWRNPFVFGYCIIVMALVPARYYFIANPSVSLGVALLASLLVYYAAILALNWRYRDWSLLVYPLYSLAYTLVLIPVGVLTYFRMAFASHNFGIIRPNRPIPVGGVVADLVPEPAATPSVARHAQRSLTGALSVSLLPTLVLAALFALFATGPVLRIGLAACVLAAAGAAFATLAVGRREVSSAHAELSRDRARHSRELDVVGQRFGPLEDLVLQLSLRLAQSDATIQSLRDEVAALQGDGSHLLTTTPSQRLVAARMLAAPLSLSRVFRTSASRPSASPGSVAVEASAATEPSPIVEIVREISLEGLAAFPRPTGSPVPGPAPVLEDADDHRVIDLGEARRDRTARGA